MDEKKKLTHTTEIRLGEAERCIFREALGGRKSEDWTRFLPHLAVIAAALIGFLGSVWATHVESKNSLELERRKAQSSLVLEAMKAGDIETVARNLSFMVESGLLEDDKGYLQSAVASHSPVLPGPGGELLAPGRLIVLPKDSALAKETFERLLEKSSIIFVVLGDGLEAEQLCNKACEMSGWTPFRRAPVEPRSVCWAVDPVVVAETIRALEGGESLSQDLLLERGLTLSLGRKICDVVMKTDSDPDLMRVFQAYRKAEADM